MVDRRTNYTPGTSDSKYYEKQVRIHTIYSDLEDAKKIATEMLDNWKSTFVRFYNFVHANTQWFDAVRSIGSSGPKGAIVRVANYVLSNYLFTGRQTYDGLLLKATRYIPNENKAKYLITITICTAIKQPDVTQFLTNVNRLLLLELSNECPRLAYNYALDEPLIDTFENLLRQHPMPTVPRSYLYYMVTGISTPKQTTQGSQGGEAIEPATPSFIPSSPENAVKSLSEVLASFRR